MLAIARHCENCVALCNSCCYPKPKGSGWPRVNFSITWFLHGQGPVKLATCLLPFRNHTFIMLHLLLQGLVYAEYTWEVFGYCQELGFSLHYLLLPYLLLVINLVFFTLSCVSNPGKSRLSLQRPAAVGLTMLQTSDPSEDSAKELIRSGLMIFRL